MALLVSLSTLTVAGGTLVTVRQVEGEQQLTRDGQVTDRYTAAVANLGNNNEEVRLGGLYALQRIAQDSPRDAPTVVQVISAYVRGHAPAPKKGTKGPTHPRNDVAAALSILVAPLAKDTPVDLHGANLYDADLHGADLQGADLHEANLQNAYLLDADLRDAFLVRADLHDAILKDADLHKANLYDADLHGIDLIGVDLHDADLTYADLHDTNLEGADLHEAYLESANLTGANLTGANLKGVHDLSRATGQSPANATAPTAP
ncbi:pentapeptide repeat-containing protein [Streptomyces odontomachi]|uniref:pentapeptide repeat-containing protein n=1 Tax=Streptomyces odontomachi TaxID=2944940 RepID=UPI00210BCDFE|nr:pentapeptide repeat-containing protein [Streptomyces sp. ODS25]